MSSDTLPPEVLDNVMRCGCLGCKGMRMMSTGIAKAEFDSGFEAGILRCAQPAPPGDKGAGKGKGGAARVLTVQRLVEKVESVREGGMDKNLVVSLDEIKGIRLQCKECGSEVVVSPTNHLYGQNCPQGHLWQESWSSKDDYMSMFLGALRQLIESPAPFKAVRLEIDGGQVEESDAEGRNE